MDEIHGNEYLREAIEAGNNNPPLSARDMEKQTKGDIP